MGGEERGEERKHRSRSPSSSPERERRPKKEHKKHKKHKKHKRHRNSSPSSSSGREDEVVKQAKAFLKQHLKGGGGGGSGGGAAAAGGSGGGGSKPPGTLKGVGVRPADAPGLSADDYFQRSGEFTAWLLEARHQYFNELTTEQTHALFGEFAADWNAGRLPLKYYAGLVAAPVKRTTHQWKFKGAGGSAAKTGMGAFLEDDRARQTASHEASRAEASAARRASAKGQRELLDELLPKATGREAKVEARMARREAARAREDSPELMRVTGGGDVMGGGGDDSFAAAKAREARRQEARAQRGMAKREELAGKLAAAQAAEAAKMAQFRALLQHGPISIPKRQP